MLILHDYQFDSIFEPEPCVTGEIGQVWSFFRQALVRTEVTPKAVITDHPQPYVKAVAAVLPLARHGCAGLHRCRGPSKPSCAVTTPPVTGYEVHEGSEPLALVSGFWEASKPFTLCAEARWNCATSCPGIDQPGHRCTRRSASWLRLWQC